MQYLKKEFRVLLREYIKSSFSIDPSYDFKENFEKETYFKFRHGFMDSNSIASKPLHVSTIIHDLSFPLQMTFEWFTKCLFFSPAATTPPRFRRLHPVRAAKTFTANQGKPTREATRDTPDLCGNTFLVCG